MTSLTTRGPLAARVMRWAPRERTHAVLLLTLIALWGVYFLVYCWPQPWYIEDAAISFSYARNLVEGEGLVPYPGGERVEGYSNPLWTLLLAGFHAVWVTPWISAKILGFVFGAATLPLVYLLARRARPEAETEDGPPHSALLAPFLLAASTQFTVWSSSGLENGLFCFLLAAGIYRLAVEVQDDRRAPWSAVLFFLLTATRPDGVAYAAIGLTARLLGTLRRRQWLALPLWIVALAVPFALYNWWRYEYFAWWFPNTYYAKEPTVDPLVWTSGGWKQFKEYATQYWIAFAIPLPVLALLGFERWRKWVGLGLLAVLALLLLWNGRDGLPSAVLTWWTPHVGIYWQKAIVWYIAGASVLLGLLTLLRPGWEVRAMIWASFAAGAFFWVWSGGDWMKAFRWGSLISVPLFTLCGLGIGVLIEHLPFGDRAIRGRVRLETIYGLVLAITLAVPNTWGSYQFAMKPETGPNSVHRRVNYMSWVQRRLGIEDVTLLDVDMGAHLWWSGWEIMDMAGLVDLPVAHHKWERAFTEEYVFEERRPEFAHVHGSWANKSKIPKVPKWKQMYFEIPGYPTGGRTLHVGCHVRKDFLLGTTYAGQAGHLAHFGGGVTLAGWEVPAPRIASGGKIYVDTAWYAEKREKGFRVLVLLLPTTPEGRVHAAEVVPGYDWYKPEIWKLGEYVWGRWSVPVPDSLPHGTYDLGLVLLDEATGAVLPWVAGGDATQVPAADAPVRYMKGEYVTGQQILVGTAEEALAAADEVYNRALTDATNGSCEDASRAFRTARRHVARNDSWYNAHKHAIQEAMVGCYLRQAESLDDDLERAAVLAKAHDIDHRNPRFLAVAAPLGAVLDERGDAARAEEDWETAYRSYSAALSIVPTLAWARRHAEEARDHRLRIFKADVKKDDVPPSDAGRTRKTAFPKPPR